MRIATIDLETDPFKYGREPMPFAAGFYDGADYREFWGDDCVKKLLAFLNGYDKSLVIFAHNGGKFDYWFMAHALAEPLLFIDSRLVKAKLFHHEIRDSYKILPVPLAQINKDDIDYNVMERATREKHKDKILRYLKSDCLYLHEAVAAFVMRFGDNLTIGGAALKELSKHHKIKRITPLQDSQYRKFFHGGRCEVFEVGKITSRVGLKLYDVNSLYPYVCAEFEHPNGAAEFTCDEIPDAPFYLAHIIAESRGALPVKTKGTLSFPHGIVESYCTSHEIRVAQQLGLIKIKQVLECYAWETTIKFDTFVNKFNAAKIAAEKSGDKMGRTFNKLIMNNAYGKTAQNPDRFKDWAIFDSIDDCESGGFEFFGTLGDKIVGRRPTKILPRHYRNVAIGASVTGAGRATWLEAWFHAKRPVAGDTDSLWCEALNLELDQTKLGAWKLEAEADTLYVAGKKMYAASKNGSFYIDAEKKQALKMASKGVRMSPEDIARVALGDVIGVEIDAPSLRIGVKPNFIKRKIARTAEIA